VTLCVGILIYLATLAATPIATLVMAGCVRPLDFWIAVLGFYLQGIG